MSRRPHGNKEGKERRKDIFWVEEERYLEKGMVAKEVQVISFGAWSSQGQYPCQIQIQVSPSYFMHNIAHACKTGPRDALAYSRSHEVRYLTWLHTLHYLISIFHSLHKVRVFQHLDMVATTNNTT